MKQYTTEQLKACISYAPDGRVDYDNPAFVAMWEGFGKSTHNPRWVMGRIGEELLDRDEIDPDENYRLTD